MVYLSSEAGNNMTMSKQERANRRAERKAEREASAARSAAHRAETLAVVTAGKCPCCGATVRRNLALTGWWQCAQYGADGFRKDSSKPACSWQGFTE